MEEVAFEGLCEVVLGLNERTYVNKDSLKADKVEGKE